MAEWKKFTGSKEQFDEIQNAKKGVILIYKSGVESSIARGLNLKSPWLDDIDWYLICKPHRHAEKIKRWVDTGQPVYERPSSDKEWVLANDPAWNPLWQYTFDVPRKFIEVRDYLYETCAGDFRKRTAHKKFSDIEDPESAEGFIRWLDDDWKKIEI